MGISVSFYNKKATSEFTSVTYSTMGEILRLTGLHDAYGELNRDYGFTIPSKKVIPMFEEFLRMMGKFDYLSDQGDKYYRFVRQMVRDYNDMRKNGQKPRFFGGA